MSHLEKRFLIDFTRAHPPERLDPSNLRCNTECDFQDQGAQNVKIEQFKVLRLETKLEFSKPS